MDFFLRRSPIDPHFVEIVCGAAVVQEKEVSLAVRNGGKRFSSRGECLEWLYLEEIRLAKSAAYQLLTGRQYSRAALEKKLLHKHFSLSICALVLDDIQKLGYLNDFAYAENFVEQQLAKGYGPRHIERQLRFLGMETQSVRTVADRSGQMAAIKKALAKNRNKKPPALVAFLLRRGFDSDCISEVMREWNEAGASSRMEESSSSRKKFFKNSLDSG